MPQHLRKATRVEAAGTPPKTIDEFVGRVNTGDEQVSIAHMRSPGGWSEPWQRPDFREITLVLAGRMQVDHDGGTISVGPGEAIITEPGERIRYSTPDPEGCQYVAVCLPAFSPDTVHREEG